jgi:hypothetical protein
MKPQRKLDAARAPLAAGNALPERGLRELVVANRSRVRACTTRVGGDGES